jgi:hypothetical protein
MGDELGVVSRNEALVDAFVLLWVLEHVGENELSHLEVISEDVKWEIDTFGNSDKLEVLSVWLFGHVMHGLFVFSETTASDGGEWSDPFFESVVTFEVLQSEAGLLLVEEFSESERVVVGWVILELMEEESVVMVFQEVDLDVGVVETLHVLENTLGKSKLAHQRLVTLAHHEDWEVLLDLFVGSDNKIEDGVERLLVLLVGDGFVRISWNINSVDFLQEVEDLRLVVEVANWHDGNSGLFEELNVSLWDVGDLILGVIEEITRFSLFVFKITSEWFSKHTINGSSII